MIGKFLINYQRTIQNNFQKDKKCNKKPKKIQYFYYHPVHSLNSALITGPKTLQTPLTSTRFQSKIKFTGSLHSSQAPVTSNAR